MMKSFDVRVLASITSGILLIEDFNKVHEAIEWLAGYPVWTHELPETSSALAPALLARFLFLPTEGTIEDWRKCAADLIREHPNPIELPKGTGVRTRDPDSKKVLMRNGPSADRKVSHARRTS